MSVTNEHEIRETMDVMSPSHQQNGCSRSNPAENGSDATTSAQKRKQKMRDLVFRIVAEAKALGSLSLDLSNKELKKIPDEVLELEQLEVN